VSSASHRRRFEAVARRQSGEEAGAESGKGSGDQYIAAVHEADRRRQQEKQAATALVAFAQALAGTVLQPRVHAGGNHDPAREPVLPATPRRARDIEPERLDPRAEVTWEEAMRQALRNQTKADPSPPRRPTDRVDPWPGGEFLIPSYARDPEEDGES
jgi:hypothetical protein